MPYLFFRQAVIFFPHPIHGLLNFALKLRSCLQKNISYLMSNFHPYTKNKKSKFSNQISRLLQRTKFLTEVVTKIGKSVASF